MYLSIQIKKCYLKHCQYWWYKNKRSMNVNRDYSFRCEKKEVTCTLILIISTCHKLWREKIKDHSPYHKTIRWQYFFTILFFVLLFWCSNAKLSWCLIAQEEVSLKFLQQRHTLFFCLKNCLLEYVINKFLASCMISLYSLVCSSILPTRSKTSLFAIKE